MASLDNVIEITELLKKDSIDFFLLTVENFSGKPKFFVDYNFKDSEISIASLRHINLELAKIIKTEEDKVAKKSTKPNSPSPPKIINPKLPPKPPKRKKNPPDGR